MSTSDVINSIISLAKFEAIGTVEAAKRLVGDAVGTLNTYEPVYPRAEVKVDTVGMDLGGHGFSAEEKPPNFPGIREPTLPRNPVLQDLDAIDATFNDKEPDIDIPDFRYDPPAALDPFTETPPDIDSTFVLPQRPELVWPEHPAVASIDVRSINVDPLVVPTLDLERKPYNNPLNGDWRADYLDGQSRVPSLQALAPGLLAHYAPGVQQGFAALTERISAVLEGRATALSDTMDQHLYDQLRARVDAERVASDQRVSDAVQGSGWGLPGRVQRAMQAQAETVAAKSLSAAALEVYTKRAERELQHLQFVMELANKLHDSAMQFVLQAVESDLSSFKAAMAFADSASGFALKVFELRQRDHEIDLKIIESDIAVFEGRLRAEQAKYEAIRLKLALEKLKSEVNHDLIATYTADLQANETRVRIYTAEIAGLEAERQARKFPLDLFEDKLKAHLARLEGKKAEYALLEAQIGADKSLLDGRLSKLKAFETRADLFKTRVGAQSARLEGQSRFNDQKLKEFVAQVDAQLKLVQTDEAIAKQALLTYEAMARVFVAESQQNLAEKEFAHKKTMETARLERDVLELDFNRQFKSIELDMQRLKTLSDALMSSARVHGDMANSALSALNSVVSMAETQIS